MTLKMHCFQDNHEPVKEQPKIRHCERSEAILSFKARLLRCARKDEVHRLCAILLSKRVTQGDRHCLNASSDPFAPQAQCE